MNVTISSVMNSLGIMQKGDPILAEPAALFDLPTEASEADSVLTQLRELIPKLQEVHNFAKGMGVAAPQIGIGRQAAIVVAPNGDTWELLNPRVIQSANDASNNIKLEGCLSFFDSRHEVGRASSVTVEYQNTYGEAKQIQVTDGIARLFLHELDHLNGLVITDDSVSHAGAKTIQISEYDGVGKPWD